ncbi:MAG: aminotransferase class III-fold pyridoxal phosphate-dependent enzyme [Planctomycetes bacterium]|nr:aminotransferase class III-fold pyridoxal phosphate-dependent enzyme [Planctomycetota bacterium]
MASASTVVPERAIAFPGEEASNDARQRASRFEPIALRTYTPSLAVLARSAGSYHWTPEGRKLADFTSGVLVANLGHNPTAWWRRVEGYLGIDALDTDQPFITAAPLTAYNAVTPLELDACERLVDCLRSQPGGTRMEQVLWAASGSEAVQKALWAAMKRIPGRDRILATRFGFHGKKGLAGAVTGSEQDPERDPRVRFIRFPMEECVDLDHRRRAIDLTVYEAELREVDRDLSGRVACLITEPYLGGGGSYHPQPEYLQLVERFCRERDIVFILDEIQSNFGRTGPLFAFTRYGIEPDLVCLGKGLGNGVPVSAVVGRADVLDSLRYGEGSDTWSANPLSAAAVLATLDDFRDDRPIAAGRALARVIEDGLVRLQSTGLVAHVRGEGCVWGIECGPMGNRSPSEVAVACVRACYVGDDRGRAIHLLGPLAGKVIRVSPPLVMPVGEARDYLDAMRAIFECVARDLST